MNWKDVPHLFANGEFRARENATNWEYTITGYDSKDGKFKLARKVHGVERDIIHMSPDELTLIARPISDLSYEEMKRVDKYALKYNRSQKPYEFTDRGLLYLISIGCYPFDQEAFDNGSVINANQIETNTEGL